jgi:hypothetical protein
MLKNYTTQNEKIERISEKRKSRGGRFFLLRKVG